LQALRFTSSDNKLLIISSNLMLDTVDLRQLPSVAVSKPSKLHQKIDENAKENIGNLHVRADGREDRLSLSGIIGGTFPASLATVVLIAGIR
jgi:hypothetical protein